MFRQLRNDTDGDFFHSREYFQHRLELEKKRAIRKNECLCVVTFDVGRRELSYHFPDRTIKKAVTRLAELINDAIRSEDVAAWYNSSTLVLLLPDTNPPQARQCVRRLTENIHLKAETDAAWAALLQNLKSTIYCYPDEAIGPELRANSSNKKKADPLDAVPIYLNGQFSGTSIGNNKIDIKRAFDVVVAGVLLFLLSPLMALIAVAIRLTSPGPVIFRQKRVGYGGRQFTIYKFRTMHRHANEFIHRRHILNKIRGKQNGPIKIKNDARVTPVGRILRRTCLDELPQLINVLKGDMSMVGPRPHPVYEVQAYPGWFRRRLTVRPGMTGVWQIRGQQSMSYADAIRMDLDYIDQAGFLSDAKILLYTFPVVFNG